MTLKSSALGAIAMLMAGPAFAGDLYFPPTAPPSGPLYQPPSLVSAHVELGLGALFASTHGIFEGAGRLAFPLHSAWNLEVEVAGNATWEHNGSTYSSEAVGGYVHAFHKTPQRALGGFAGAAFMYGSPLFVVGVEGNWYINAFAIYAQASYNIAHDSGDSFGAARLGLWYYTNPMHKIGAYVAWQGPHDNPYWEVAAAGEHRFANYPVSVYGRAGIISGGMSSSNDHAWYLLAGARFFTDGPDLWTSDQNVPFSVKYIF